MKPTAVAKFFAGRMHYAWVVLVVMFFAMLAGVGVRAAPGVMILPLVRAFGWSVGTISTRWALRFSRPAAGGSGQEAVAALEGLLSGSLGGLLRQP